MAPPIDEPLSNSAVASARSRFGNHSETALVAPGQLADSAIPSRVRNVAKLYRPRAREVVLATREYSTTVMLRPRRVPMRSIMRPRIVCPSE